MNVKLSFWLRSSTKNNKRQSPIVLHIHSDYERVHYSTGYWVIESLWDSKHQKVKGKDEDAVTVNDGLTTLKARARQVVNELLISGKPFNSYTVRDKLKNGIAKTSGVIEAMDDYIDMMKSLEKREYATPTIIKYTSTKERLREYMVKRYKRNDIKLYELDYEFMRNFDLYLRTEYNNSNTTIYKHWQRFSRIIKVAIQRGYLDKYPFGEYKVRLDRKPVEFLTYEEIVAIENKVFDIPRLKLVQQLFLFSCYTGLAYKEMENLRPENIITGVDGHPWIQMVRQKSKKEFKAPLLPTAVDIINTIKDLAVHKRPGFLLPIMSNQKLNSYVKEIAEACGIKKRVIWHMGRKSFAVSIILRSNISIETLSSLLGHSQVRITSEFYTKVTDAKISSEMNGLRESLMNRKREITDPNKGAIE